MGITHTSLKLLVILVLVNVLISDNSFDRQIKRSKRDLDENESTGDALYEVDKREEIAIPSQNNDITVDSPKDSTSILKDSILSGDKKSNVGKKLKETKSLKTKLKKDSKVKKVQNNVKSSSLVQPDDEDARLLQGMDSNVDHPMANNDITKRYDASADIMHGEMMGMGDSDNYDTTPNDLKRSTIHTIYTTDPHSKFKFDLNRLSIDVKRRSVENLNEQNGGTSLRLRVNNKSNGLESNANSTEGNTKPVSLQVRSQLGSALFSTDKFNSQTYTSPSLSQAKVFHERQPRHFHHHHHHHRRHHLHHRHHHYHNEFEPERFGESYFRRNGFEWNQPLSYYSPFFRAPPYSMSWGRFSNPYEYHMGRRWISSPSYVRSNVEGALDPRLNSGIFANGFNPGIALPDSENLMAESLRKPLQNEGERMALEHLQNIHMSTLREFAQSQEERRRELEAEEFRFQHSKLMNPYLPELQHVPLENPFHLNDFRQNHNSLLANRFSRNFEKTSFQDPYLEMKPEQEPNNVFDQFSVHSPSLYESQFDPSISEFHHHSDFISHFKNEPKNFIDGVTPSAVNRPGILRVTGMEKRSFNEEGKFQNSQMERPEFEMQFSNKQIDDMNPNREYSRFHNEDYPSYQSSYGNRISGRHSVQEYRDSDQPSMFRDNESDQIESKTTSKLNSLFDTSNVDAHRPIDSPDSAPLLEGSLPDSSTLLKNPGSVPDFHDQLNAGVQDGDQQNEISEQAEALREDKEFAKISQIQEEMYKKLNDVLPIGDMPRPDLYPTESKKAGLKHLVPSQTNEIKKKEDIYGYKKYEVPIEQKYKNNFKKDHLPEDIKLNLTISNATSDDLSIFDKKSNTSVTSTLPLTPQVASSLTPVTLPITSEKRRSTKNLLIEVSNSKVVSIDNSFNEEKRENTILLEKKIHQNVTKKSEIGHRNKAHANDKKFNQKKNLALKRKNTIFLKGKKKNDIIVRRPQIVFHPPPEIYHRPPIILHRPPLIIQRPPIVYHQPPVVVHRPPVIYAQPPIIFHQPSPVVHQPFLNSKDHWGLMTETNFKHIGSSLSDGGEWSSILPGNVLGTNNQVENYPKDNEDSNNINYDNNLEMTLKPDMTDTILKSDETTNVKNSFELKEKTSNLLLNTVLNSTSLKKSSIHSKNKEKKQLRVRKKREVKKNNDHKGTKKDVVVNRPPIIYHPPPEIYHRPDIVIHRPPIVIHRPPIIYHQPPVIVHRPAVVYHQPPIIFHQPPPAVQQPLLYSHDTFVVHPSFVAQHMGSILRTAHHYIGPPRLITQLGSPLFESSLQEEKPAQESLQVAPSSNNYPIEQSNLNGFTNYQGEGENTALNEENQYSQMQNMPNTDDQGALSNEMVSNKNTFNSLNGRTLENTLTNSETDQAFMNNAVDNPSMQPESYNSIQDNYSENNNQMFKRSNIQNVIVHQPPVVLNHREVIFHQVPLLFHRPPIIVHQAPLVNHQPSIFYQQPNGIFHASSNMMNHEPTFSSYSLANHLPMANITNTKNSNSSGVEEDTYEHSFNEITDNTKSSLKLSLYSDNFDQSEKIDSLADPLIDNSFLINHPSLTVENGNFLGNDDKSNNVKSHNTLIDKLKIDSAYNSNSDLMKSYVSNRKNDSHVKITQLSVPSSFHRLKKNKIDKLKHGDKKYSKREVVDLTHKITQPYFNSTRNTYTRDAQTTSHIGVKSTDQSLVNSSEPISDVEKENDNFREEDDTKNGVKSKAVNPSSREHVEQVNKRGLRCSACGVDCNPLCGMLYDNNYNGLLSKPVVFNHEPSVVAYKPPVVIRQPPVVLHPVLHRHKVQVHHLDHYQLLPHSQACDCSDEYQHNCMCLPGQHLQNFNKKHHIRGKKHPRSEVESVSTSNSQSFKRCIDCGVNCDPGCHSNDYYGYGLGTGYNNGHPIFSNNHATFEGADGIYNGGQWNEGKDHEFGLNGEEDSNGFHNNEENSLNNYGINELNFATHNEPNHDHETTVYKRPDIVVPQPPDIIHRPDIVIHRAPIIVHRRPIVYHQAPVIVHKPPVVVHQAPIVVHPVVHHHRILDHHIHNYHVVPHHTTCDCEDKKDCICGKLRSKKNLEKNIRSLIPNVAQNNSLSNSTLEDFKTTKKKKKDVVVSRPPIIYHPPPEIYHRPDIVVHRPPLLIHRPSIIYHQPPVIVHRPAVVYHQPPLVFHQPPPAVQQPLLVSHDTFKFHPSAYYTHMGSVVNKVGSYVGVPHGPIINYPHSPYYGTTGYGPAPASGYHGFGNGRVPYADPESGEGHEPIMSLPNSHGAVGYESPSGNMHNEESFDHDQQEFPHTGGVGHSPMGDFSHFGAPNEIHPPNSFNQQEGNFGNTEFGQRESEQFNNHPEQQFGYPSNGVNLNNQMSNEGFGAQGFDRSFSESSSSEQQATMGGVSGGVSGEENSPIGHLGGEEFSNQQSSPYKRTYIAKNENEDNFEKDTYRERRSKNLHLQKNHHQHPSRRHRVVVGRPDIIYHQAPEIVHRPPLIVHRPDIVIHRPSVIVHRPPVVVHRPAIMYHQPPVVFNSPLPVIHQPNAISHDMYVAHSYPHRIGSHVFPSGGIISQVSNVEHEENMGQLNNIQNDENIQNVDSGMLNSEPNEEHDFGIQGPSAYNNGFPSEGWGTGPNAGVDVTPNNVENIGADYESPVRNQYAPGAFLQEDGYSQSNLNAQPVTGNNQVVHFSRGEPNNILNQFGPLTTNNYVPLPEEEHPWTKSKVPKKKSNQVSGVKKQILVSSNHGDFSGDVHDEKYPHENSNFVGCEGSNCHEDGYSDGEPFHEGNERFADGYDGHNDYHDLRYSRHHPAGVHATVLYRPDVVFHPRPELYHRPDIIVHRPDVVIHRPSVVIHQPPVLVHRPAVIVHQPPIVFHQPPPVVHRPIAVSHDNYLVHDNHEHVGSHLEHAGHVVGQGGYDVGTPFENAKDIDNLHSFSHPHYENIHNEFANEGNLINTHGFSNNLNDNFDSHTHNVPDYNLQPINNIGTSEDFDNPSPAQFQEEKDLENVNSENLSSKSVVTHHKGHKKKKKNKKKTKVRREIKESNHTESEIEVMKKSKIQNSSKKHHVTVIHRPDVVFHQRPEVIHRPDIIVHRPDVVINRPDVIIHRPAVIVHKPPMVIHQAPIVFHHSHPMMHQPIQHQNNLYVQNTYPDHDGSHIENLEHSYPVDIAPQINNSPHIYSEPVNVGHIMMERVHSNGGHVGDTPTMGVSNNVLENEYHLNLDNNCNNYNCHNFGGEPVGHEHLIGPIGFAPQYPDTEDDDARSHIPKKNNQIAAKKHHVTVIHRPDIIYHPKPEIVHRPDVIVHRPDIVIHRPSVVVHRPPVVVHKSPVIIHQPPIILHQPNPIINQPIHQSHDLYAMKPVPIQVGSRLEHVSSNTNIHELGPTSETSSNILDQGNFHETQTFPINGQNSLNNGHEVLDQPLNLNDQGNNGMESINYLSSNERGLETQLGNNLQSSVGNKNLNSSFVNIDENHEEPNSIIGNYKQDYTINNNHIGQTGGELNVRSGELSCDENSDPQCNRSKKNKVSKLKNKKKLKLKNITGFKRDFGFGSEGISRDCIGSHCGECHDGHCGSDISDHQGEESFGHHGFGDVIGQHAGSGIIGHGGISGHGIWGDHGDHWGHGHENTWEHHNDHHHHHADEQNIVVQRPDIVFHPRPELYHRPDIIVHRPDIVIHRPSVVIHQPPVLVHRPAVIYHQPPVVFHQPGPVVHRPRVVSHDMYVTHDQHEHVGSQIEHAGGGTIAHAGYYENHDIGHSHDDDDDERGEEGHHGHEGGYEGGRSGGEHHDELGYGGGHHFEHGFGLGGHEFNCLGGNCGHEDEHAFKRFLVDSPNELHQAKAKRHRVVVFRPPIIYHPPPEIYHRADLIVHRPDVIISRPSVVVHRPDVVIHRPNIVYHQPPVVFYTPPPHIHQPIIKSHDSYVTHPIYRHIGSNVEHVGGVFLPHTYPANNLVPFQDSNLNQYTNEDALQENSQTPVNNFIGQNYHNQEQTQETEELEGLHEENPDEADNSVLNNVNINPHQDLVSSTSPINAQQNLVNEPQPGYNVAGLGKSKVEKHRKHKKRKHSRRRHRRNIVAKRSIKSTKKVTKNNKKKKSQNSFKSTNKISSRKTKKTEIENSDDKKKGKASKKNDIIVKRPPVIYHPPPEIYHRPPIIVHRPPLVIRRPPIIYHQPPVIVHRPAVVYHQPPLIFHQPPPAVSQPILKSHDTFMMHPAARLTHMGSMVTNAGTYVGVPEHRFMYQGGMGFFRAPEQDHQVGYSAVDNDNSRGENTYMSTPHMDDFNQGVGGGISDLSSHQRNSMLENIDTEQHQIGDGQYIGGQGRDQLSNEQNLVLQEPSMQQQNINDGEQQFIDSSNNQVGMGSSESSYASQSGSDDAFGRNSIPSPAEDNLPDNDESSENNEEEEEDSDNRVEQHTEKKQKVVANESKRKSIEKPLLKIIKGIKSQHKYQKDDEIDRKKRQTPFFNPYQLRQDVPQFNPLFFKPQRRHHKTSVNIDVVGKRSISDTLKPGNKNRNHFLF
ncbi:uncharacterized protein LOC100210570 isoform X1 [Hydra vulgaris]|uniref:Uncharacterized protein LOC100210570 isoform X1 n=1 Tax=Hydra vulgaris TaxID=6087 RepID=A0ABM4D933_HYDVU